jgi:ornithine cyclodeaminase
MVSYIGTERLRSLVAARGAAQVLKALSIEIAADYRRWDAFEKTPRLASHSPVGVIELMPASDGRLYSFKYVNGHPKNTALGRLTVTAFGVLADVTTGYPRLLAEMTFVTALRTAAISALAAQHLARSDARSMALIGNGAQSEFQALAFHALTGVRELRLFDTDPDATRKLSRNLARLGLSDLTVRCCESSAQALRGADIVTTVTADKCNALILTPEMIEPGMHINAVGGDCPGKTELDVRILERADARIVVEFEPQARIEGEIQQLPAGSPVIELAQVLRGLEVGRNRADEVTIFDSVGFALNDFSSLRYLERLDQEIPGGEVIDLIPALEDPKDLWGGLVPAGAMAAPAAKQRREAVA